MNCYSFKLNHRSISFRKKGFILRITFVFPLADLNSFEKTITCGISCGKRLLPSSYSETQRRPNYEIYSNSSHQTHAYERTEIHAGAIRITKLASVADDRPKR